MHGNDPWMFQARDDLRFTNHSVAQICGELRCVEDFDSDETIKLAIFSQTNYTHPATSELFHKRVLRRTKIRLAHDAAQVFQFVVRKPPHSAFDSQQRACFSAKLFVSSGYLAQLFENDAAKVATCGSEIVVDCHGIESEVSGE